MNSDETRVHAMNVLNPRTYFGVVLGGVILLVFGASLVFAEDVGIRFPQFLKFLRIPSERSPGLAGGLIVGAGFLIVLGMLREHWLYWTYWGGVALAVAFHVLKLRGLIAFSATFEPPLVSVAFNFAFFWYVFSFCMSKQIWSASPLTGRSIYICRYIPMNLFLFVLALEILLTEREAEANVQFLGWTALVGAIIGVFRSISSPSWATVNAGSRSI